MSVSGLSSEDFDGRSDVCSQQDERESITSLDTTPTDFVARIGEEPSVQLSSSRFFQASESCTSCAKAIGELAKNVPAKFPGTEASFQATKAAICQSTGIGAPEAIKSLPEVQIAAPDSKANKSYKDQAQEFCKHGVIVKTVFDHLKEKGVKYDKKTDITKHLDEIANTLTNENLGVTGVSVKNGVLQIALENGKTLRLTKLEEREGGVISSKVIVSDKDNNKTAFRFNYHTKETDWVDQPAAFRYKGKKVFEAAVFKYLIDNVFGDEQECLKIVKRLVESAEDKKAFQKQLEKLSPRLQEDQEDELLSCQTKYLECLKEVGKEDKELKNELKSQDTFLKKTKSALKKVPKIPGTNRLLGLDRLVETPFDLRKEALSDFSAYLEAFCCTPDEDFHKYQQKDFALIDNKSLQRIVNIADIKDEKGNIITHIDTRAPLREGGTIPTTIQDSSGLANYAATSFATYTKDEGVIVDANFNTHCRPIPIAIKDPHERMAIAQKNVLEAVENQARQQLGETEKNSVDNPLVLTMGVTTLFSPGSISGAFMGRENEHNMLAETALAYESVNNRVRLIKIDGKEIWVKPVVTIQNFGINKLGRLEVGVDDALNARGMAKLHAQVESFLIGEGTRLVKEGVAIKYKPFKALQDLLTPKEIKEKEKEIQQLEQKTYEEMEKEQKELEKLYKLLKLREELKQQDPNLTPRDLYQSFEKLPEEFRKIQDQIDENSSTRTSFDRDSNGRPIGSRDVFTGDKEKIDKLKQNKIPVREIEFTFEEIEELLTYKNNLGYFKNLDERIDKLQEGIQGKVKQLQTLCRHTDNLRRDRFSENKEQIKGAVADISQHLKGLAPADSEKKRELENLLYAVKEYVDFQEAAYLRGPGAGRFGLKPFRSYAKETVLEPAALLNSLNERIGAVPYTFCKSGKDRTGSILKYIHSRRMYTRTHEETPGVVSISELSKGHELTRLWNLSMSFGTAIDRGGANTGARGLQASGIEWPDPLKKKAKESTKIAKELGKGFGKKVRDSKKVQEYRNKQNQELEELLEKETRNSQLSSVLGDDDLDSVDGDDNSSDHKPRSSASSNKSDKSVRATDDPTHTGQDR